MPFEKGQVANPTGKGGFGDNPQNQSPGGWRKEESIPYWQNYFIRLPLDEFYRWKDENAATMTVAQDIAWNAVISARGELPYLKEVTDRTSGKAPQTIEQTVGIKNETPLIIKVKDI